jgi:hypothetical protein
MSGVEYEYGLNWGPDQIMAHYARPDRNIIEFKRAGISPSKGKPTWCSARVMKKIATCLPLRRSFTRLWAAAPYWLF